MNMLPDGGGTLPSLSHEFSPGDITMDLTMCGLLVDRAEELVQLYAEYTNWNEVKTIWFDERRANRSTRGSAQKIHRVLTSRLKNAPTVLPNPKHLPAVLDDCTTSTAKAQVLYPYLVADDPLVRYVVHEYIRRQNSEIPEPLDFSNDVLQGILEQFDYADGTSLEYADSTIERWCVGFRSLMREIGVIEGQQSVIGQPPVVGDTSLLVAIGYSYEDGSDEWFTSPVGLQYLFQPPTRWEELYDRIAKTDAWEFVELHSDLQLQPVTQPYSWINTEEAV